MDYLSQGGESTVRSIRDSYLIEAKRRRVGNVENLDILPHKKRGRPPLLGEALDLKVQQYLRKVRDGGGTVTARIAVAAARGLLLKYDKRMLAEFGGPLELNRHWAYSLYKRMKFVRRKATTAKSKYTIADFERVKKTFLDEVISTVTMEEIPPELILNWDQTGIKIVPSSPWTMDRRGARRVEMIGTSDKRQITAVFCGTLVGDFLPIQLIYKGKTARCHPRFKFPSDWHITHSPNHWSTEETMLQYITNIIVPYVRQVRHRLGVGERQSALVNFKGQITAAVNKLLEENDIHVCLLPPNSTDVLQPMDLTVNKPAKECIKGKFENWYADQIMEQLDDENIESTELQPISLGLPALKELGAQWLVEMYEYISDNPVFIVNGFIRSGISGALNLCFNQQDSDSESSDSEHDELQSVLGFSDESDMSTSSDSDLPSSDSDQSSEEDY